MPLRAEIRHLYGARHRAYRAELIKLLGPRCTKCGTEGERYLNMAHLSHDPLNGALVTLWCPSCHASNDASHRIAVMRRTQARRVGQLWLFPEVEWCVFPSWERPRSVDREAQEVLWPS